MINKKRHDPLSFVEDAFMQMDLHKAQVKNHVAKDIMVVFGGLKEYL